MRTLNMHNFSITISGKPSWNVCYIKENHINDYDDSLQNESNLPAEEISGLLLID